MMVQHSINIVIYNVQDSTHIVTHNVQDSINIVTHDVRDSIHILTHVKDSIHIVIIMFENIWKQIQ